MNTSNDHPMLPLALRIFSVVFVFGLYPLTIIWPSGWSWDAGGSHYLPMILVIYATLGIFLWIAAKNPLQHRALISFTIWSSIAHGGLMAWQSLQDHHHMGHLLGDVPALFIVAALFGVLSPKSFFLSFDSDQVQCR